MSKRTLKKHYAMAGLVGFVILFAWALWPDFSWGEAALSAAVLTVIGIAVYWRKKTF